MVRLNGVADHIVFAKFLSKFVAKLNVGPLLLEVHGLTDVVEQASATSQIGI